MLISQSELDSKRSREPIPLECYNCKTIHYRTKNIVLRIINGNLQNTLKGCFCSKECRGQYKTISRITCQCKQCNQQFERLPKDIGQNVFCNKSCSAKYNNSKRILKKYKCDPEIKIKLITNDNSTSIKRTKNCKFCNTEFIIQHQKTQIYCSSKCRSLEYRTEIYKRITSGEVNGHASKTMRQYLLSLRGQKCEMCGITEWGGKPLVVVMDHINGNSSDNSLTNLRLICSNCDTLTPTYKCRNKGNGRAYRRQRYADGKSY